MMKQTLCLLLVLAFIAQIGAIPADKDVEKEAKAAGDSAETLKKKGTKDLSDAEENATGGEKKATEAAGKAMGDANKATHAAADAINKKGHHGQGPKHGGKDCHKPGAEGPVSGAIKGVEKFGKDMADAAVKPATNFFKLFGL